MRRWLFHFPVPRLYEWQKSSYFYTTTKIDKTFSYVLYKSNHSKTTTHIFLIIKFIPNDKMLYCIFNTYLGDVVLESVNTIFVLNILFSFSENNCITESIYKIIYNKTEKNGNVFPNTKICQRISSASSGTGSTGNVFPNTKNCQRIL